MLPLHMARLHKGAGIGARSSKLHGKGSRMSILGKSNSLPSPHHAMCVRLSARVPTTTNSPQSTKRFKFHGLLFHAYTQDRWNSCPLPLKFFEVPEPLPLLRFGFRSFPEGHLLSLQLLTHPPQTPLVASLSCSHI